MVVNGAGAGKPDFVGVGVVDDVQQDIPQAGEPVRLAGNESVQGQAEDQGLPVALAQLLVEVRGDHAGKVVGGMAARQLRRGIVDFDMVGN